MVLVGYSGHAYVVADCLRAAGYALAGYCERQPVNHNPLALPYLGFEAHEATRAALLEAGLTYFVALGDNALRRRVQLGLRTALDRAPEVARHPSALLSPSAMVGAGTLLAPRAVLNAFVQVGEGTIINTAAILEHENVIGDFAHIAPGAVLAGNVTVGAGAFVGAGAVVRQGITIGAGALVGAGAVVVRDVPPGRLVRGNPARDAGPAPGSAPFLS